MSDVVALQRFRDQPMFSNWAPDVSDARIAAATESVRRLIDDILALGVEPAEKDVRSAVRKCVQRFNELDELDANG